MHHERFTFVCTLFLTQRQGVSTLHSAPFHSTRVFSFTAGGSIRSVSFLFAWLHTRITHEFPGGSHEHHALRRSVMCTARWWGGTIPIDTRNILSGFDVLTGKQTNYVSFPRMVSNMTCQVLYVGVYLRFFNYHFDWQSNVTEKNDRSCSEHHPPSCSCQGDTESRPRYHAGVIH